MFRKEWKGEDSVSWVRVGRRKGERKGKYGDGV